MFCLKKKISIVLVATIVDGEEVYKADSSEPEDDILEIILNALYYIEKYSWDDTMQWYEEMYW